MTNLFQLVKVMFTNPSEYRKLKSSDKAGNHFMVQRMMAINFPIQSQQLNRNGINGSAVVDTWQKVATRFTKVPGWIYTKSKPSAKKSKVWKPDVDIAKFYMKKNNIGPREFDELIKYNEKEVKAYFKKLSKQLDVHNRGSN